MSTVFISHSSQDDALTGDFVAWLHQNGFRDTFVDHMDILGGENWTDRLRDQAASCRVVICLISADWLRSSDCYNEFQAAWYMGKSILPLFLLDMHNPGDPDIARRLSRVLTETQGIDLRSALTGDRRLDLLQDIATADLVARSLRAVGAHSDIGLDPTAFAIDSIARPTPFPGLVSFGDTDADAAIFFGRSREIAEVIEELRSMRANADRRPLVILGVSGAGKSSVLKAGILPRLRRESQAWLPLRIFRPGIDPLGSFAEAISRTLADLGEVEPPGQIRSALDAALSSSPDPSAEAEGDAPETPISAYLDKLCARLRAAAGAPGVTILISVDQAEELLRSDSRASLLLSACLAAAMAGRRGWLIAFTIRTDRFPDLQGHPSFRNLKARGYDLRQLPAFRFSDVIEGPAARYGVTLAPDLVDAFMEDAPERDALPLLAFALQRLWEQFSVSRVLRLEDYTALGRMSGLISDAAERALAGLAPGDGQTEIPTAAQLHDRARLAERCFVPALVDVTEAQAATRRIAQWSEFDAEEKALLRQFEAWRLIVRRGVGEDATVEVAHEALFREWPRMRDWLEPEIHRIAVLRGTVDAARQWDLAGRPAVLLNHRGPRLADARALLEDGRYGERLGAVERAYLARCAGLRRRASLTFAGAAFVAVAAIGLGIWSYLQSERRMIAEREATFAARVADATGVGDISTLESFTHYILNDPYAVSRADRFDILREVLAEAVAAVHPEYAIAEYALDAVDLPDQAAFELEYSAERVMYADLFPVLWRPYALSLSRTWGLPAPEHIHLVENPDFPPGRVIIRRSGQVVFDAVLPATDTRHMLDVAALDRADLRAFFEANTPAFTSAEGIAPGSGYYYVPDWSVPIWNAGRDRNADSRVIPPGADFALILSNLFLAQPGIVIDDLAVEQFFRLVPSALDVSVAEYRAIRGERVKEDLLAWLQAGYPLGDILFSLGTLASLGPDGAEIDMTAVHDAGKVGADPYMHGPVLGADYWANRRQNAGTARDTGGARIKSAGAKKPGVPVGVPDVVLSDAAIALRRQVLDDSFRHFDLPDAPIRIVVAPPSPDQPRTDWPAAAQALLGDNGLRMSAAFARAREEAQAALFRQTGLLTLDIAIRRDTALAPGEVAVEFLDSLIRRPIPLDTNAPEAILDLILAAIVAEVEPHPNRFVFAHSIAGYLEAASGARREWAQATFAQTDLMQLVAGLIQHETLRPEMVATRGGTSLLLHFDWLLGGLVYSVATGSNADGRAHLDLWRDLAGPPLPLVDPDPEIAGQIDLGISLLIADDMIGASAAFAEAAGQDPDAARAVFLSQYHDAAPKLLFGRIDAECAHPTRPSLGVIEARQLAFLLGSFGPDQPSAISDAERVHYELCLLGAQDQRDEVTWLDAALGFAADLGNTDDLTPDQAIWLGRNIWRLQDPLRDNKGVLPVGRRFLLSGFERIDDPQELVTITLQVSDDCRSRLDLRPCMRRVMEIAEETGKPIVGLDASEILASSIYPRDHRRAETLIDLFQATYGMEPTLFGAEYASQYRAYLNFIRGLLHFSRGAPGSDDWKLARKHLMLAKEHDVFRFSVLPTLSRVLTSLDGFEAAEDLATKALVSSAFMNVNATDLANLVSLRFFLAVEAGHGEDFLDDIVALPETTGCTDGFGPNCVASWLWRATGQVVYRYADWQTVARIVTSKVDHPYSTLIALMLNAQGGEVAGSGALLRRNWDRVDPTLWGRRIELEDEGVWREILLGYAVGEVVDGYRPGELLEILQDPAAFADHGLSRIGMHREEMLTEALFYSAMLEIAQGRAAAGKDLLRRTRALGYWQALEYSFAQQFLLQMGEAPVE